MSPVHGRVLIYVWAVEQDEQSKRVIPTSGEAANSQAGKDVVVPWVLSRQLGSTSKEGRIDSERPQVFNRYYHMFAKGELAGMVHEAVTEMGLEIGQFSSRGTRRAGVVIVQDGWERSNYFVELKRWKYQG